MRCIPLRRLGMHRAGVYEGIQMPTNAKCPFCQIRDDQVRLQNAAGLAIRDAYPVSEGHTLVVPKKHVASLFDLPAEEYAALWRLVAEVRHNCRPSFRPPDSISASTTGRRPARLWPTPISM